MRLRDGSGISCDWCGCSYRQQFVYLSLDFRQAASQGGMPMALAMVRSLPIQESLDWCEKCGGELCQRVVQKYKAVSRGLGCDWTGAHMAGQFQYWAVEITRVSVRLQASPSCAKCGAAGGTGRCLRCGHDKYVEQNAVQPEPRFLELALSQPAYLEIMHKVQQVRKVADQWSGSST